MIHPTPEEIDVSRETLERLKVFADLLVRWNSKINLVSQSSLDHLWTRHIVDSLQVLRLAPENAAHWADLGSGGGFPGLIVAIASHSNKSSPRFTLVESDGRKSAFLRTAIRETGIVADVVTQRIETLSPLAADVISARALSNLSTLLEYGTIHLSATGCAIFPKGETWQKELAEARKKWQFDVQSFPSLTDPRAVVLIVRGIDRV